LGEQPAVVTASRECFIKMSVENCQAAPTYARIHLYEESNVKYMLMMNAKREKEGGDWQIMNWAPDDLKAHIGFMIKFSGELKQSGNLVGAEGLAGPSQAKIVRAGGNGAPEVTDGPFAESKEFLAGYWIVDVDNPQKAYDIAARASAAPGPGGKPLNMPIEVREVMSGPPSTE
jgi:hypothetical protein